MQYSTGRVLTYVIPLLLQRVISPAMMRSSTPWLTKCAGVITGGMLFCPLALFIGMEERVTLIAGRGFALPATAASVISSTKRC